MRRCCFTYFPGVKAKDVSVSDLEEFPYKLVEPDNTYLSRAVWQYEVTPHEGNLHVQGYLELTQPRQFQWIKKHLLGTTAHIEKARGSAAANFRYCTKDASRFPGTSPFKIGDWDNLAGQGRRSDIEDFAKAVIEAPSLTSFLAAPPIPEGEPDAGSVPFASSKLRYINHAQKLWTATHLTKKRMTKWDDVDYMWICGPSGVGKTHWLFDNFDLDAIYMKNGSNRWWDGYEGQQVVIVDDYRANSSFDYSALLTLLDLYPLQVEVKGAHLQIQKSTTTIAITCNHWPWDMFKDRNGMSPEIDPRLQQKGDLYTPLVRRVTLIEVDHKGDRKIIEKPNLRLSTDEVDSD